MKELKIFKRFKDDNLITIEDISKVIDRTENSGYYKSGTVLGLLEDGFIIQTDFSLYSINRTDLIIDKI